MTPETFENIRIWAGFSVTSLAATLRIDRRTVHRYKSGEMKIPGPIEVLMELLENNETAREQLRHDPKPRR